MTQDKGLGISQVSGLILGGHFILSVARGPADFGPWILLRPQKTLVPSWRVQQASCAKLCSAWWVQLCFLLRLQQITAIHPVHQNCTGGPWGFRDTAPLLVRNSQIQRHKPRRKIPGGASLPREESSGKWLSQPDFPTHTLYTHFLHIHAHTYLLHTHTHVQTLTSHISYTHRYTLTLSMHTWTFTFTNFLHTHTHYTLHFTHFLYTHTHITHTYSHISYTYSHKHTHICSHTLTHFLHTYTHYTHVSHTQIHIKITHISYTHTHITHVSYTQIHITLTHFLHTNMHVHAHIGFVGIKT